MDTAKSILFEPTKIKNMELRNRFIRSATYDGCADDGYFTNKQVDLYSTLSEGGVGLIITGITYVHESGQISKFQNSISSDEFIPRLKRLTYAVHDRGAKIAVQLFHAGREGRFLKSSDTVPIAPSFIEGDPYFKAQYRAITTGITRHGGWVVQVARGARSVILLIFAQNLIGLDLQ